MIYNPKNKIDIQRAETRFKWLIENEKTFELTQKQPKRTNQQNRYLHLILGLFALEYGDTLDYVKLEIFKKIVNPDIFQTEFVNKKTGEIRDEWNSSANLDTAQLTTAIDKFRNYSSREFGLYLPEPHEEAYLAELEKEIENNRQWL